MKTAVLASPPTEAVHVIQAPFREKPSNVVEPRATRITASSPGWEGTRASPERRGRVTTRPLVSRVSGAIPEMSPK